MSWASSFGSIVTAGDLGLPEPEETGTTFVENALIKARSAAILCKSVVLADDSGLCVTALGVIPAFIPRAGLAPTKIFAMPCKRYMPNLAMLRIVRLTLLRFWLVLPDGREEIFEGRVDGHIIWPPRGDKGHGYDPVFVPMGDSRTFAEMTDDEKNAISHRGRAIQKLLVWLAANK